VLPCHTPTCCGPRGPGRDGHGRADDPNVAYDTVDSAVVGIYQRTMATKVRRVDVATYRCARGEILTEEDMEGQ
jgi:hypothetical protein